MRYHVLFISLFAFISGCSSNLELEDDSNIAYFEDFRNVTKLEANPVRIGSRLVNPRSIVISDSLLFVIDTPNKTGQIQTFTIDSLGEVNFLFSHGKEGNGPGEYFGLNKLEVADSLIYAYDISYSTVTVISIDSILTSPDYTPSIRYYYERPKIHNFELINSNTIVVGYYRDNPRLRIINNFTDTLKRFHNYPPIENKFNLPEAKFVGGVRGNMYQGKLDFNTKSNLLVLAYFKTTCIDLIDYNNLKLKMRLVGNDDNYPPDYTLLPDNRASRRKDSKSGFNDIQITDNFIYALYSGKTIERNFGDLLTGTAIYKFDHDGNPIAKYIAQPEITSFAVDEENSKIYAVNYYDDPFIVFDLPKSD